MSWLSTRIPPPAVALVFALGMRGLASASPRLAMSDTARIFLCATLAVAALVFSISSVLAFKRARTTLNPVHPGKATSLVTSGIFQVTRNPMYLSLGFLLCAWAVYLSSAWALAGVAAFVLYVDRLQIIPEEEVLAAMFGAEYAAYRARVRRWL